MKKTKSLALLTAAVMVFVSIVVLMSTVLSVPTSAATGSSSSSETSSRPVQDQDYVAPEDPHLSVYEIVNTVFKAGDIAQLPMTLDVASGYANNIRMRLIGPEGKENMFSFYSSTGSTGVPEVYGKTLVKPFVQVAPSVPDGNYSIKVEFTYTMWATTFTTTSNITLSVHGRSDSVMRIKQAAFAKAEIGIENKSTLNVNIFNPSVQSYKNVSVSFNSEGSKGFSLYENFNAVSLGTIEAGKSGNAAFSVYVDSATATGNYPMTFDVTYVNDAGDIITSKEVVPVQVNRTADADGKGNVPRIIVSKYATDVKEIKAGQEFTLDFSLQNTSTTSTVRNIKVVLSSTTSSGTGANATTSEVFFAAAGSNSFYIPSIAPSATSSNTIKLMSRQDVEPGVYSVQFKIDYEDEKGNTIPTATEQISFALSQEQRLEIQSMNIPTDGMVGSSLPINFQYINKGKATIYNLSVTVEGDFTMEGGSMYIGNLTAGYNDYFDSAVIPTGEGSKKGAILLKYEDASGNEKEHRTEFTCNVAAGMEMGDGMGGMGGGATIGGGMMKPGMEGMPVDGKAGGSSLIWWIGIPVVVLLGGGVVTLIILKKRKAKKAKVEDEED